MAEPSQIMPPTKRSFTILGTRIAAEPFAKVLDEVLHAPDGQHHLAVHFATAHTIVEAQQNPALRHALQLGQVEPDGMPLVWLGRRHIRGVERVCGPDFMPALVERGVPLRRTHYFFGGAPGVAEQLANNLSARFPGVRVVGTAAPPFRALSTSEDEDLIAAINEASPDYVWVGLGAPKQDIWIAEHRARLNAAALLGVGAAFDFHAGTRRRAPRFMQKSGTEWVFRFLTEPRRLAGRYTATNLRFLQLVVADWFTTRKNGERA